jgi:hypothetical protein
MYFIEKSSVSKEGSSAGSDIEENLNRLELEHETARNLDEALEVLGFVF